MELLLALVAGGAGLAMLLQAKAIPSEADFKKAKEKLDANPVDPDANTTAGKYIAFVTGDYTAAMPYLVHSNDKTLKSIAEHELDATYTDTAVKKVGMGDEWVLAAKKSPALARLYYDRASQWYGESWAGLDGVWKDRTRTQLQKILQNPNVADPKSLTAPSGWKANDPAAKGSATTKSARGGKISYQVVAGPHGPSLSIPLEQVVAAVPGRPYEFSAWMLPDGTDSAEDQVAVTVFNAAGVPIDVKRLFVPNDQPWWHYVSLKFDVAKTASQIWVQVATASKKGNLFIDDMSLRVDGKEVLKNPSFEDK